MLGWPGRGSSSFVNSGAAIGQKKNLVSKWIWFACVPAVLPEFQNLIFAVRRCAAANSKLATNLLKTDMQRLRELNHEDFMLHRSSGDGINCLIHSACDRFVQGMFDSGAS